MYYDSWYDDYDAAGFKGVPRAGLFVEKRGKRVAFASICLPLPWARTERSEMDKGAEVRSLALKKNADLGSCFHVTRLNGD